MRGLETFLLLSLVLSVPLARADHEGPRALRPLAPPPPRLYGGGRLSQARVQLADSGMQANTFEEAANVCRQIAPQGYWQLPRELDIVAIGLETMQATLWNYAAGSPLWLQPERSPAAPQQGRWSFLGLPRLAVDYLEGPRTARVYCVHSVEVPALFTFPRLRARFR